MGLFSSLTKPPSVNTTYTQGPTYAAGQTSTDDLLSSLTQEATEPNYGAISPDWNDIWNQTQQQVQDYFGGTATSPGVNDAIKSSFAQRGMGGDPAESFTLAGSNADEAQDLGNLSAQQNIAEQTFGQQAQQNWYTNMLNFQNQTANGPAGGDWNTTVTPNPIQQLVGAVAPVAAAGVSAGIQSGAQQSSNAYLAQLLGQSQNPSSYAPEFADAVGAAVAGV